MRFKRLAPLLLSMALGQLSVACGLVPNFSNDGMSSKEKAALNLQMGVRYMELGMLEVARDKFEIALSNDSSNAEVHNALAVFYERIHDFDRARDSYQAALSRDAENFSTKNNYGRFLCDRGDFEKGIALLQQSLDSPLNNRNWLAMTSLGICLVNQQSPQRAEDYFRQALQANPDYAPALLEMQKISYKQGQFMSSRAFLERYLAAAKHTAETLWIAFQTERALGNAQMADEYKQQLLNTFPASTEAQQVKSAISK